MRWSIIIAFLLIEVILLDRIVGNLHYDPLGMSKEQLEIAQAAESGQNLEAMHTVGSALLGNSLFGPKNESQGTEITVLSLEGTRF